MRSPWHLSPQEPPPGYAPCLCRQLLGSGGQVEFKKYIFFPQTFTCYTASTQYRTFTWYIIFTRLITFTWWMRRQFRTRVGGRFLIYFIWGLWKRPILPSSIFSRVIKWHLTSQMSQNNNFKDLKYIYFRGKWWCSEPWLKVQKITEKYEKVQ